VLSTVNNYVEIGKKNTQVIKGKYISLYGITGYSEENSRDRDKMRSKPSTFE